MTGTLALVGAGEYLPGHDPIDRWLFARLGSAPRVACLATAAGTEGSERIGYWDRLGVEHYTRLGATVEAVPIIDRHLAEDERLATRVRQANFVYLSGGKPAYLHETLVDTPVLRAILAVLDAGGVVAGCSAGAMVWGEYFRSLRSGLSWQKGFNRASGAVVIPHFDEIPGLMLRTAWETRPRDTTLLGIDRNTALVLSGGAAQVVGTGGVTVWSHEGKQRHLNGATVTWP